MKKTIFRRFLIALVCAAIALCVPAATLSEESAAGTAMESAAPSAAAEPVPIEVASPTEETTVFSASGAPGEGEAAMASEAPSESPTEAPSEAPTESQTPEQTEVFTDAPGDTAAPTDTPLPEASAPTVALRLGAGESAELSALLPEGCVGANYASSDENVALVDGAGRVTAVQAGECAVTALDENQNTVCIFQVSVGFAIESLSIEGAAKLSALSATQLSAKALPEGAQAELLWTSSDEAIAQVDQTGLVTGVAEGIVTVTVCAANAPQIAAQWEMMVRPPIEYVVKSSGAEFAQALGGMTSAPAGRTRAASASEFSLMRLIVYTDGTQIDFSPFTPMKVLSGVRNKAVVSFYDEEDTRACYESLISAPGVRMVYPDAVISAAEVSEEDAQWLSGDQTTYAEGVYAHNSWGVDAMGTDSFIQYIKACGRAGSARIAVIDSGVYTSHSYFSGKCTFLGGSVDYIDPKAKDALDSDGNGHGTHVAGIIADCLQGVGVEILVLRVLDASGNGHVSDTTDALEYAAEMNADVANLSLGTEGSAKVYETSVNYALGKGVTVCIAAGNDAADTAGYAPAYMTTDGAIVVSALKKSGGSYVFDSGYSNFGASVDVACPGSSIRSTYKGGSFATMNGTSMATPHASAAAALLGMFYSTSSASAIERKMKAISDDLGAAGKDPYYGSGIPNFRNLIPASIRLNRAQSGQPVGGTLNLTATVLPALAETTLTWRSSDETVVTVAGGAVSAVAEGEATVTATTTNGLSASCLVTVTSEAFTFSTADGAAALVSYNYDGGEVSVPETYGGYPVTAILAGAFAGSDITSAIIPESVTSVGIAAFGGCEALTDAFVYNRGCAIDAEAFEGCLSSLTLHGYMNSTAQALAGGAGFGFARIPVAATATFAADGKTVAQVPFLSTDAAISAPDVPAKVGYSGKWEAYEIGESDLTIDAVYSLLRYTITWKAWTNISTTICDHGVSPVYGGQTPLRPADEADSYVFAGWQDEAGNEYAPDEPLPAAGGEAIYTAYFSATPNVARVGEAYFWRLDAAVAALADGDTLTLLCDSAAPTTVSREITFTLESGGFSAAFVPGEGYGRGILRNVYTFSLLETGDVNLDLRVNSMDVVILRSAISEGIAHMLERADVNGDGRVNSMDVSALRVAMAGYTP